LHDYSFRNNLEFGVFSEHSTIKKLTQKPRSEAWQKCMNYAENNEVVFIKRPVFKTKKFIINYNRTFDSSHILFDSTEKFYGLKSYLPPCEKNLLDFPLQLDLDEIERPERVKEIKEVQQNKTLQKKQKIGYCIRKGTEIPFNPKYPLSKEAWRIWNIKKNYDYKENYCHKSGEKSYGKTTMRNPILEN